MRVPSRRLTLVVLAALFASAATMWAQDTGPEYYLDLLMRYRAGESAEAIKALLQMPPAGLRERVDDALWSLNCRTNGGLDKCRGLATATPTQRQRIFHTWRATYPAALLLHLETIDALYPARRMEDVDRHRQIVRHLLARMRDMTTMPANADAEGFAALESVRRRGQLLLIWTTQGRLDHGIVENDLEPMLRERPNDPDLLLGNAWVSEVKSRPALMREQYRQQRSVGSLGDREAWLRRQRSHWLSLAERQYRRVLAVDARNAEAHLRLGRVVALGGRADEGRRALQRAFELTEEPRLRYLARLFDAAAREDSGDAPGARESYDAALRIWPTAQSARLGLSRLRLFDRNYAAARDLLPRRASSDLGSNEPADPWAWYEYGQWWRVPATFASMKVEFRP
jgi:tetratricopeptide (TPR) repeat protein